MPYTLGDRIIPLDVAWSHLGIQYPPNWLRLSSKDQRVKLGLKWVDETIPNWDRRFYQGRDEKGVLIIIRPYRDLQKYWIKQTEKKCHGLLAPTNLLFLELLEEKTSFSAAKTAYNNRPESSWRTGVKAACKSKCEGIMATERGKHGNTELDKVMALEDYINSNEYKIWPKLPSKSE